MLFFLKDHIFNLVHNTSTASHFTHRVRSRRCAAPIGRNSGCGRGKETRRRGRRRYSRSLLWQFLMAVAGEESRALRPTERPVGRERGQCSEFSVHPIYISCVQSSQRPTTRPSINSLHPSSPVCILLSRFEPLLSPTLLPHADVSPSDHESHFPLSLFPGEREMERRKGTDGVIKKEIINITCCMQTQYWVIILRPISYTILFFWCENIMVVNKKNEKWILYLQKSVKKITFFSENISTFFFFFHHKLEVLILLYFHLVSLSIRLLMRLMSVPGREGELQSEWLT